MKLLSRTRIAIFFALVVLVALPYSAAANHAWGPYHWARTSNPFTLKLVDNVPSTWDLYLTTASSDWSVSDVLDTVVVPGNTKDRCTQAGAGLVKVCAKKYGSNGWLGIAQIWIDGSGHIAAGVTKMNDTYFSTKKYNTPAWRQLVMCQEVGHTFGLDHQDEDFSNPNLGTCMDYTSNPDGPPGNLHPNAHDYEELALIYGHLDPYTTLSQAVPVSVGAGSNNGEDDFGRAIRTDPYGRPNVFAKDLGNGAKKVTWVFWIEPGRS